MCTVYRRSTHPQVVLKYLWLHLTKEKMKYSTKRKGNNGITSAVSSGSQREASCSLRNLVPHRAKQGAWRIVNFLWMVGSVNEQTLNTHQTQISLLHILFFTPSRAQEHPLGEWNGLPGYPPTLGLCGGCQVPTGRKEHTLCKPTSRGPAPTSVTSLAEPFSHSLLFCPVCLCGINVQRLHPWF